MLIILATEKLNLSWLGSYKTKKGAYCFRTYNTHRFLRSLTQVGVQMLTQKFTGDPQGCLPEILVGVTI